MKFINKQAPILNTYQSSSPHVEYHPIGITTTVMQQLVTIEPDLIAWYCLFTTGTSFMHFDIRELLGENVYADVMNKKVTLVLDMSFEPFLSGIDSIYCDIIMKHNIPSSQVIFVSNMYDALEYSNNAAIKYSQFPIRVIWVPTLELMVKDYITDAKFDIETLTSKEYPKKFLNFNRRWRSHRPLLTLLLYYKDLLKDGFVSFGPCEGPSDWVPTFDGLRVSAIGNQEMSHAINSSMSIKDMPPLYLDVDDLAINQAVPVPTTNKYYEDSYFSVVSETTFYYRDERLNSRFLTEKTFKAILSKHPFILVSIPKSLEVLKELGYKTFSPWIDESYDQEMDDNKRMMMILAEIERLCKLDSTQLEQYLVAMREVCEYNYNLLKTKTNFIYEHAR